TLGLHQYPCVAAAAVARGGADSARPVGGRRADRRHHHAHGAGPRHRPHAGDSIHGHRLAGYGRDLAPSPGNARRGTGRRNSRDPVRRRDTGSAAAGRRGGVRRENHQGRGPHRLAAGRGGGFARRPRLQSLADCRDAAQRCPVACLGRRAGSGPDAVRRRPGNGARRHRRRYRRRLRPRRAADSAPAARRPPAAVRAGVHQGTAARRRVLRAGMRAPAASARSLAAHAVARILREGVTLDAALKDALAAADRKLAPSVRSLSYGAVRGYYRHEAILGRLLSTPVRSLDFLVRALLSVALYELEDEKTPQYAVVDAAVQTAKATDAVRAAGLINAVLRRYLRERKTLDADIARNPATRHASPVWLADRLRADWPVRWTQLLAAGDTQAPMWLRVNRQQATAEEYLDTLRAAGIGARVEARVPHALALDTPCDVQDLPGFAQGLVSVQDLG